MKETNRHIINEVHAKILCRHNHLESIRQADLKTIIAEGTEQALDVFSKGRSPKPIKVNRVEVELSIKNVNHLTVLKLRGAILNELQSEEAEFHSQQNTSKQSMYFSVPTEKEAFIFFLQTGQMKWFAQESKSLNISDLPWLNDELKDEVRYLLKHDYRSLERLVMQFATEEVLKIMSHVFANFDYHFYEKLLLFIRTHAPTFTKRYSAAFLLEKDIILHVIKGLASLHQGSVTGKKQFEEQFTKIKEIAKARLNGEHQSFLKLLHAGFNLQIESWSISDSSASESEIVPQRDPQQSSSEFLDHLWKDTKGSENVSVTNAGVILLHPFLAPMFKKVGLLEEGKFISSDHQQRAICLLHFLATGEQSFPEEQLLLYKFLCGFPFKSTVPLELPISEFEKDEAITVLMSVIHHWQALKNTSVDGLRANFIQRKGMLSRDQFGHVLHVEKSTPDILLNKLPWGISMLQLPWLSQFLTIKWN